ncbi:hypothetical protein Ahy_A03g016893 isoform B [Arachis hypogaea]|uniref:Vignain n=1 Tax=Arachis hypogaea TaxID=3818 RepID=A0A445E4P2_ARAHY|nr:hypothetical protein Ahy_A03g016893 isoform B [Arachis hypogaea]
MAYSNKILFQCISLALVVLFGILSLEANGRILEDSIMHERHEKWMVQHGKYYKDSNEKELRFKIFKENVERIEAFNSDGNKSYKLGINQFADLTNDEFKGRNKFKGHMCSTITKTPTFRYENVSAVPPSIDWRQKGAVTPIKDQGQCGCCWAFSAVAATEGITKLTTGKLISLSEQELVDCDTKGVDQGCQGGLMDNAFKFIIQNKGLTTESNYPYTASDGTCNTKAESNHAASIKGFEDVPANSESALLKSVANQPVSVAIDASDFGFQFYSGGVFTGSCGTSLDHGVTAVGYGVSDDGTKYWLVKNSWGETWGEQGYIRMQRDIDAKQVFRTGAVNAASGSAYAEFGNTKIIVSVFGPRESKKAMMYSDIGRLNCNVSYTTFASPVRGQGSDHKEYTAMLHKALEGAIILESFPKTTVDVFALVLESGGSDLPVVISCASLALADAGIMMYDLVASVSVSCLSKNLVIDPIFEEENSQDGSLMITCMPSRYEITQLTFTGEWSTPKIDEGMQLCLDACAKLAKIMRIETLIERSCHLKMRMVFGNTRCVRFQDDAELAKIPTTNGDNGIKLLSSNKDHNNRKARKAKKFLKARVLSRVFSEDYERVRRRILDPRGQTIHRWNKIFLVACLVSLFVDPLFFYLPLVQHQVCIGIGTTLEVILTIIRSIADLFYMIQIIMRYCTAYVAPSSRVFGRGELVIDPAKIAARYFFKGFWLDFVAALPLPQFFGACWYLLSIERQEACWRRVCDMKNSSCKYSFFDCNMVKNPLRDSWFKGSNVTKLCSPEAKFYPFGIYGDAVTSRVTTSPFFKKYFYCLWWGLRNLSSLGQNLLTSTFVGEIMFAILVATLGLVLFALLIGNMQTYLQSTTVRLEEWRVKRTDTEQWMHHRQLPQELRQSVRKYDQYKWLATRGVDEEALLKDLPLDLRRDIKRHLCIELVRRVPLFEQMDERMLDAICERLKPSLCTESTYLVREGDPVNEMLFIIRGNLDSYTTNGGRTGFFNSCRIGPGDFCGEELLTWALDPKPSVIILPCSTRTVKAISEVEAFALMAEDLKFVASQFRRLHSKQLRHKFRIHSHQWRTWAACFIQAAWRRFKKRKEAAELRAREENEAETHATRSNRKGMDVNSEGKRIKCEMMEREEKEEQEQQLEEEEEESSRFKRVCVFCGSSPGNKSSYKDAAIDLGKELVSRNIDLVYGGGSIGLMGLVSQAVYDGGRHSYSQDTHAKRGGYGTLEELLEVITWAQLGIHDKPVGLLNVDGYYNSLLSFIDKAVEEGFISPKARHIIVSAPSPKELVKKMEEYSPQHERVASKLSWEAEQVGSYTSNCDISRMY